MGKDLDEKVRLANAQYLRGNFEEAFQHYSDLASQGDYVSTRLVGWFYLMGLGVNADLTKARAYFRKGAEKDPESLFGLVKCDIAEDNLDSALERLLHLSSMSYAPANYWIGRFYEAGKGVEKDSTRALQYYSRASQSKHLYAARREALLLIKGNAGFMGRFRGTAKFVINIGNAINIARSGGMRDSRLLT